METQRCELVFQQHMCSWRQSQDRDRTSDTFSIGSYQCKWMNHQSLFLLKLSAQGSPSFEASGMAVWDLKYELCENCIDIAAELWRISQVISLLWTSKLLLLSLPPSSLSVSYLHLRKIQPFEKRYNTGAKIVWHSHIRTILEFHYVDNPTTFGGDVDRN